MITDKINSTNRHKCNGCHACATVCPIDCIDMIPDHEGFWYPEVNSNCLECGKCIEVCPIFHGEYQKIHPTAYACYNLNEEIRLQSSSGGIFHELSKWVISQNGVVFGACFNDQFEVEHTCIVNVDDIKKFQGSKYVESKIGDTFSRIESYLESGRNVLFSGTPCQIGGLKTYLRKDYQSLICLDFICHGVPSPMVWRKYLDFQTAQHKSQLETISFRAKDYGWKLFSMKLSFASASTFLEPLTNDLYLKAFLRNICLRPSCYTCDFKNSNRKSDITLGDFWGIESQLPQMDDNKGTSLVFLNTPKSIEFFDRIKGQINWKEVDLMEAIKHNPSSVRSVKAHPKRSDFFNAIHQLPFDKLIQKYCRVSILSKARNKTKHLLVSILDKLGIKEFIKSVLAKP
ncbi:Coenzyme F420 hydrogenase/dehydrogenase, beta subunit C-terminal domain [Sunxiuqinia rutila]|uniref:Coenzyme F420 hydrogenase/dehydrogenase, beta subunit C-terminal domain n=1 Tax=Sunxiuqinia rutila TaxID=1397841 RepID=UPI003D35BC5D